MSFTFDHHPTSYASTIDPPTETHIYTAQGEPDRDQVIVYATIATPASVFTPMGQLYRQDLRVDPVGWAMYKVTVPYGKKKNEVGSYGFRFDTTGATVNIRCAKEHIEDLGADATLNVNPHLGMIGVKPDGDVEGCDIVIPCLKFNFDFKHPQGFVTLAQARVLSNATGHTNSLPYLGFAAGELLFLGATGADGTDSDAEVSYQFAASANVFDFNFADIGPLSKKGWEYAWVEWKDVKKNKGGGVQIGATKPHRAYIERVYDAIDFAATFAWS